MKKKDKIFWAVYIMAGMVIMVVGLKLDIEYYSTLLFAVGFSFVSNGLVRIVGNWYHMRPENREKYQEKLHQQQINLKDERKMQLRWRAGYTAWAATMALCFVGAFVMSLFQGYTVLVAVLFGLAVLEYVGATVIYKYLCRKM
ncbi:hypothetical protein B5E77_03795 [Lachnoclostridium sp. An131]|uniref:hypothetical protein n=1 Tax=Lachnoclostridium sp. An131 TaxID=1965555 RepID=UPI000B387433|nr:hypothetical protein [Lachnoclostridium sp. An131]OUQ28416.1 hypothetical protein B5E77_03795 [Lachnoclostridium sp. An131]